MIKKESHRGVKNTPALSEIFMTMPMVLILVLFSVFPFIFSLFSVEQFSFREMLMIFKDSSNKITLEVSLFYAFFSVILSVNIGMRMAYRMYFSKTYQKNILLSILFLAWIMPSFISIPLYRSIMYWFTDNLISSPITAFMITLSARIWINIPIMTLISYASIGQTSKNQIEMMMTEGASKGQIYDFLFKPSTKMVISTFSLLMFINAMRDLNIPLMMTNGRPYISEGFTSFGIAGSTTTFGLFLKDSLLRLNSDFTTYSQSVFATITLLILFFCVYRIRKGDRRVTFICVIFDLFFYTILSSVFTLVLFIVIYYLTWKKKKDNFAGLYLLIIPTLINSLFLSEMTPGLLIFFTLLFFSERSFSNKKNKFEHQIREKASKVWNIIGDLFTIVWFILTIAVFFNLLKLMVSNPLYIPEWNEFDTFTIQNFTTLINEGFFRNVFNSLLLGITSAFIILITVFPAGYTTTIRKRFQNPINSLILFSIAITGMNTIIPLFMMFSRIKLTDTFLSVILTIVNHSIPLAFLIVNEDLKKISPSYLDTARLEGASHLQIFSKIIFPLIIPIASVISLKVVVDGFSSFTAPLMFINNPDKFPTSLRLFSYAGKDSLMYPEWGLFAAGSAISVFILFILIFPFRRFLLKGIYRSWSDEN